MRRVLIAGHCSVPGLARRGGPLMHVVRALAPPFDVDVFALRRAEEAYIERKRNGRILRVPVVGTARKERVANYQRALPRQLKGSEYHGVHVCDGWAGRVAVEMRKRGGYAVVFDVARSPGVGLPVIERLIADKLAFDETLTFQNADLVFAPTHTAQQELAVLCGQERVLVAPIEVDMVLLDL